LRRKGFYWIASPVPAFLEAPAASRPKQKQHRPPRRAWTGARAAQGAVLFDILKMSPAEPISFITSLWLRR
jgi:hypothetical protein